MDNSTPEIPVIAPVRSPRALDAAAFSPFIFPLGRQDGNWDDVSGDSFLRKLLSMPMEEASPWVGPGLLGSAHDVSGGAT